ncbi:MAG: peptidoglycan DD-metalloendopeptidase family protein [Saprospiraceae bacterium]
MKTLQTTLAALLLAAAPHLQAQTARPDGFGGGPHETENTECISDAARRDIWANIERNRQTLLETGQLEAARPGAIVAFGWPLKKASGFSDYSYYGISNYVDENLASGGILDYNCGSRTYDGHKGTDIFTWPFPWQKQAESRVEVVAGAAGTIIYRQETNPDQSCALGNVPWNAVYVQHADGSVAWYGHLKQYSLTSKTVGQAVAKGEYLGVVGSSGNSTGPHLHFEVYNGSSQLVDPWAGACNSLGGQNWWAAQEPYYEPKINTAAIHFTVPHLPQCPPVRNTFATTFYPGDAVYFASYYQDQNTTLQGTHSVKRPDGSVFASWNHTSPQYYSASYWYWWYTLPGNAPAGKWKYTVTYNGKSITKTFTVKAKTVAVAPAKKTSTAPAGSTTFSITATGAWTASDNASWVTLSPTTGTGNGTLTVNYTANPSATDSRTCRIKVAVGSDFQYVYLTQGATNGSNCFAPLDLETKTKKNDYATLWWEPNDPAPTNYQVEYQQSGAGSWTSAGSTSSNFLNIGNLAASTAHKWRVRAVCGNGNSAWSQASFSTTAFAPTPDDRGNDDDTAPSLAATIGLYPNPASDELMLELPDHFEGATRIQCFSQTGKMMFSRTFEAEPGANTLALDVRPLADGLYFLQILHENTGETAALKFTMSK